MTSALVMEISRDLFQTALMVALPALAAALIVGLIVSLLQAVTGIQDQTVGHVRRILIVGLVLVLTMGFTLQLGFAFSLFLLPAQIAGAFVSNQVGLALGPQPGPSGHNAAGPLAVVFEVLASLIFLELNGHHVVLAALHASFSKLPIGGTLIPQ